MSSSVPPEAGSPFADAVPGCESWDGYWTRDHAVTEAMAWLGLAKPAAEQLVAEHGPAVVELIRTAR
jgi:hypothetical protein